MHQHDFSCPCGGGRCMMQGKIEQRSKSGGGSSSRNNINGLGFFSDCRWFFSDCRVFSRLQVTRLRLGTFPTALFWCFSDCLWCLSDCDWCFSDCVGFFPTALGFFLTALALGAGFAPLWVARMPARECTLSQNGNNDTDLGPGFSAGRPRAALWDGGPQKRQSSI